MQRVYFSILCLYLLSHAVADNDDTAQASGVIEAEEHETGANMNNNVTESNENQNSSGADQTNQTSINEKNQTGDDVNNNNTMQSSHSSNENNIPDES